MKATEAEPGRENGSLVSCFHQLALSHLSPRGQRYRNKRDARGDRWSVYIYRPDQRNAMGESYANPVTLASGQSEQQAIGWRLTGPGGCEDFVMRVGWVDDVNRVTLFPQTDGRVFTR